MNAAGMPLISSRTGSSLSEHVRRLPSHLEESKSTQHFEDLSRATRACSTHRVTSSKKPRSRAFRPEKDVIRPKQARREREQVSGRS